MAHISNYEHGFNLIHFTDENGIEYKRLMIPENVLLESVIKAIEGEPLRGVSDIVCSLYSFRSSVSYDPINM